MRMIAIFTGMTLTVRRIRLIDRLLLPVADRRRQIAGGLTAFVDNPAYRVLRSAGVFPRRGFVASIVAS
jgi:hypothetical protein